MARNVSAVLVMARHCRPSLLEQLEGCGVEVLPAGNCQEAHGIFEAQQTVQVVLTDATLPDGNWRSVLDDVRQKHANAEVVVCTYTADPGLWCEILEQGAYDLLVAPYPMEEVRRIIEGAAARSCMRSQSAG